MIGFYGKFTDDKRTLLSSSGGAATALAEQFIRKGGQVLGVCYSNDFSHAEYYLCNTIEEIDLIRGTKYLIPKLHINNLNISLFSFIKNNTKPLLIFGLGCIISSIKFFCDKNNINSNNIYFVELICHGATPNKVHQDYIQYLKKKYKSNLVKFNIRYKINKWKPFYIFSEFQNGQKYYKEFYHTQYGYGFSNVACDSCYSCKYKDRNHQGDLIIGDCWSKQISDFPFGLSLIVCASQKGLNLMEVFDRSVFEITQSDVSELLSNNKPFYLSRLLTPKNTNFKKNLFRKSLFFATIRDKGFIKYFLQKILGKID